MRWVVVAMASCIGCGSSPSPSAPTPLPPPILTAPPTPRPWHPVNNVAAPTGLPALAECNVQPNYVSEVEGLYRRGRLPMILSIAGDEQTLAYAEGIRRGAQLWAVASGGAFGTVDVGVNRSDADVTIRVAPAPTYDCRVPRQMYYGIFIDPETDPPRIRRGGDIYLCPENFGATPGDVLRVAKVVGHEVGHALGLAGHSGDAADLMYGEDYDVLAPAASYPWVSRRDLNTLGTAYCK